VKRRRVKRHWYRRYIGECPVCGRNAGYRERVYGRPPRRNSPARVVRIPSAETYDQCMEW
jgi:hypothetical protein